MDGEGMQVLCKLHFKGTERDMEWYFEKGIKQQSWSNVQGWTLNLNWVTKRKRQRIDTNV